MILYDPIRKKTVAATPEERVRQALLRKMIEELGYPKGLLVIEQELPELRRRVDLLCYTKELAPLLVVECKAKKCSLLAREQVFGYNSVIGAPYLCLASEEGVETLWREGEAIRSIPFLPAFHELCRI